MRRLRLAVAFKRFNPSQPRILAGNPDGGQWTSEGGGSGGEARIERVSSRSRQGGGTRVIRGRVHETTPAQEVRLDISAARARTLVREVKRHDPNWRPRPSIYEGVEGEILANESAALEAAARLRELRVREPQVVQSPSGYLGLWYRRPDGSIFGVRRSEDHGITIDVIQYSHPHIPNGYKVNQKRVWNLSISSMATP